MEHPRLYRVGAYGRALARTLLRSLLDFVMSKNSLKPFKSDGCSGGLSWYWRNNLGGNPPWEGCCVEHDEAYHKGGSQRDRVKADLKLYECVRSKGHPIWAAVMWYAVRVGGHPYWPTPFRWGFGRDWPSQYTRDSW